VQIIHLDLRAVTDTAVELRYLTDSVNQGRSLPLSQIADLIEKAERDYYVPYLPEDYALTGRRLYEWLDGTERWLSGLLNVHKRQGVVLAIATAHRLAHLPWEVLHDGKGFLVEKLPGVLPVRWVTRAEPRRIRVQEERENRALNVLFMACSPTDVEPELAFEAEEGKILDATERHKIGLTVEESGCLTELGFLMEEYGRGHFDVLHLTGHATLTQEQPAFVMETETGTAHYASPTEIARELQFQIPRLLFLSGCRTGQAGQAGAVPSMAQQMIEAGALAVLGWGQPVLDTEATTAGAALYGELAAGTPLTESVLAVYQALLLAKARDWHLLRLYVGDVLPGALVTSPRHPQRKPAPLPSHVEKFLDPATQRVKVPDRKSFVGRRRQLQNCLRALRFPSDRIGVLVHGMGGLGKSSLAARLCDRLSGFTQVVWVGALTADRVVDVLTEKLERQELREGLQQAQEPLKFRLKRVFAQMAAQGEPPFLLVLDDFEHNLETRGEAYVLKPTPAAVMEALVWAMRETGARDKLILTCRYAFESSFSQHLYLQGMDGFKATELRKKCEQLPAFAVNSKVEDGLQARAQALADGNPRLLEWLGKVLCDERLDRAAILDRLAWLEADRKELMELVLAEALLAQISTPMQALLRRGLIFELPVPQTALVLICEDLPQQEALIQRCVGLGLLEVSPDGSLRVPRILPLEPPENLELLARKAAQELYQHWWKNSQPRIEVQCREIHRLAVIGYLPEIAIEVADKLADHWNRHGRVKEAIALCYRTLSIQSDARIYNRLAWAEDDLGMIGSCLTHYQKALSMCPEETKENLELKTGILNNIGNILSKQGQNEDAISFYKKSLELANDIEDFQGIANALNGLSAIYTIQGDVDKAIEILGKAIKIYDIDGDIKGKADALHNLSNNYIDQGKVDDAIELYKQSLKLKESINDIQGKAGTLYKMAEIYRIKGEINEAISLCEESLAIFEYIGHEQGKAATLNLKAHIHSDQGQVQESIALYEKSLKIYRCIGNAQGIASSLDNMAAIYVDQGNIDKSIDLYNQSLEIYKSIGYLKAQVITLHKLAIVYASQGRANEAILLHQQSIEFSDRIDYIHGKLSALNSLATIYTHQGKLSEATAHYKKALEITNRIGNIDEQASFQSNLATIYFTQGKLDEAITLYQQSLEIQEYLGNKKGKAATLVMFGQLLADKKGEYKIGLQHIYEAFKTFAELEEPEATIAQSIFFRILHESPYGEQFKQLLGQSDHEGIQTLIQQIVQTAT
jgi:tetratricopeptide (TPR) repeat protein